MKYLTLFSLFVLGSVHLAAAQKTNQQITFNNLAAKSYGDSPFTLVATATSGLPSLYQQ